MDTDQQTPGLGGGSGLASQKGSATVEEKLLQTLTSQMSPQNLTMQPCKTRILPGVSRIALSRMSVRGVAPGQHGDLLRSRQCNQVKERAERIPRWHRAAC